MRLPRSLALLPLVQHVVLPVLQSLQGFAAHRHANAAQNGSLCKLKHINQVMLSCLLVLVFLLLFLRCPFPPCLPPGAPSSPSSSLPLSAKPPARNARTLRPRWRACLNAESWHSADWNGLLKSSQRFKSRFFNIDFSSPQTGSGAYGA